MAWKQLEQGHGFGYMEYWDPEDWAHPEYPEEIFPDGEDMSEEASAGLMNPPWYGGSRFEVYQFNHKGWSLEEGDIQYTYVIHHKDETWNFFRYRREV
tara:strand:+ start:491 stop:784 length:294 start_codon:yes stop_codon:yes gene_type:complete